MSTIKKVTFFDNTNFELDESITDKECKDFVTADDTTTLSYNGIYFTPKYDETKTDINTVHHIAHNGHIYTLGSDVIKKEDIKVTVNNENSIIPIISSLEANRFEKIIKYTSLSIDFTNILNRLSELERIVYGPEPIIDPETLPNIVLYYIKYDNETPTIVNELTETLTSDNSNANKILLYKTYFDQYTTDTYYDNANYILKHNDGNDITIDSNDNRYDVICIGLSSNDTYEITNICLADEHNNRYGLEIPIDTNAITIDNKPQIIKILGKQDTDIRISTIVYNEKNQ